MKTWGVYHVWGINIAKEKYNFFLENKYENKYEDDIKWRPTDEQKKILSDMISNNEDHNVTLMDSTYQNMITTDPFIPNCYKYPVLFFPNPNAYFLVLKLDYTCVDPDEYSTVSPPTTKEIKSFHRFCKMKLGCEKRFQHFIVPHTTVG